MLSGRRSRGQGPDDGAAVLRDAIVGLYRHILGREPDETGLAHWLGEARTTGITEIIGAFVESDEHQARIARSTRLRARWSLSQHGEVEYLVSRMIAEACPSRYVVDVGAAEVDISNSLDLIHSLGWRGLLVEADPESAAKLASDVAHLDATVVNCAIATAEGEATFYVARNKHVSSLRHDRGALGDQPVTEITVRTRRLATVLDENAVPQDFGVLSIDIEGLDIEVMNDLIAGSAYRPQWIILEWGPGLFEATLDDERVCAEVRENYRIVGATMSNLIMRRVDAAAPR